MRPAARIRSAAQRARAARARASGFTLVEILVVIVIVGILTVGMMLSINLNGGHDPDLDKESQRLVELVKYAHEQAELQTREYGLLAHEDGYQFVSYDTQRGSWVEVDGDDILRSRQLPAGLTLTLVVDGHPTTLPKAKSSQGQSQSSSQKSSQGSSSSGTIFGGGLSSESSSSSSSSSGFGFGSSSSSFSNTTVSNALQNTMRVSGALRGVSAAGGDNSHSLAPQVMIFSSGDYSNFELTVLRDSANRSVTIHEDDQGQVVTKPMVEGRSK
jgi:type II secretion system protein H